ncbi:ATP synthase subunit I [Brumicola pallidula]|uniref:ATP synthase protein I n=1 Tax=Brumicola pallidula DSM 14239 = ACAM 615 TaxID=1121922 RepID=K6YBN8_9ALTE|nr:ATP synthase subunit I [Glaciecola pallidula]GAC30159.1 ATP synthase protein I [Glaciecola pallidula DSM 14239 = ACAM 615]
MNLADKGQQLAKKGIIAQFITSLVLIVIVFCVNPDHTVAVVIGSITFIIPHSFFAYWTFRYAGATKSRIVAQSFNQGLKIKLVLTTVFFAIAFSQLNTAPFPVFGAYVVAMLSQWFAMVWLSRKS